jgi:hypothetical protein
LQAGGRLAEASAAWAQALRLAPEDPAVRGELARAGRGAEPAGR